MEQRRRPRDETSVGEYIAKGAMDVENGILEVGMDRAAKYAPRAMRALKVARYGPGAVLDFASITTAKNKPRAAAEAAGGVIGGLIGAAGGGVAAPVTGAIGSAAGSWAGGHLYDAGEELAHDFYDQHRAEIDATRRWMDQRARELYGRRNAPPNL